MRMPHQRRGFGRRPRPAPRAAPGPSDARRTELQAAWDKRARQQRLAWVLLVLGTFIVLTHWLEHLAVFSWGFDPALQDILVGWPAGALLIMVGLMKLPG